MCLEEIKKCSQCGSCKVSIRRSQSHAYDTVYYFSDDTVCHVQRASFHDLLAGEDEERFAMREHRRRVVTALVVFCAIGLATSAMVGSVASGLVLNLEEKAGMIEDKQQWLYVFLSLRERLHMSSTMATMTPDRSVFLSSERSSSSFSFALGLSFFRSFVCFCLVRMRYMMHCSYHVYNVFTVTIPFASCVYKTKMYRGSSSFVDSTFSISFDSHFCVSLIFPYSYTISLAVRCVIMHYLILCVCLTPLSTIFQTINTILPSCWLTHVSLRCFWQGDVA